MDVEKIMTKKVIFVAPETKITEVAKILFDNNFNGVPVVRGGKVIGIITEADLLTNDSTKIHIPSLISFFTGLKAARYLSSDLKKSILALIKADAQSVMNVNCISVKPETKITELVRILNEKHINPIPVVDDKGRLKGIVSRCDIIKMIGNLKDTI